MEENKKYSATDFARYYSGAMPPNEMHAIEKAALEDPFLADALEGYAYSIDAKKETDEIRIQLDEKRKQKKAIFCITIFTKHVVENRCNVDHNLWRGLSFFLRES